MTVTCEMHKLQSHTCQIMGTTCSWEALKTHSRCIAAMGMMYQELNAVCFRPMVQTHMVTFRTGDLT